METFGCWTPETMFTVKLYRIKLDSINETEHCAENLVNNLCLIAFWNWFNLKAE